MPKEKPQPEVERVTMTTREGCTEIIQPSPEQAVPAVQESADVKDPISPAG